MDLQEAREILFRNKKLRKIRAKNRPKYEAANLVFEERLKRKMTQIQLAKKIGTKQPSIARIENGDVLPSLEMLDKIAQALGTELTIKFLEEREYEIKPDQVRSGVVISKTIFGYNLNLSVCPASYEFEDNSYGNSLLLGTFAKNGGLNG